MSERSRLLVLTPAADLYGSDRALLHALPGLLERFDVMLVSAAPGPTLDRAEELGASTLVVDDFAFRRRYLSPRHLPGWAWRGLRSVRALRRLHRERPFVAVYSNTLANSIVLPLRLALRVPVLVHAHECPLEPRWLTRVLVILTRLAATRIVTNSQYTLDQMAEHVGSIPDRAVVVHNGIELPERTAPSPQEDAPPMRIVCVGRLHPKKGQWVLIEAAALALAEGAEWQITFWGDALAEHADLEAEMRDQVRRAGLEDRVRWMGFGDDTAQLYADAEVAVVPSVVPEEFGLVCVEAGALGLPVVATGPGGPSEIIVDGETGFIVPPRDARALADRLRQLERSATTRREMGDRAERRVRSLFDRRVFAERIGQVTADLVDV